MSESAGLYTEVAGIRRAVEKAANSITALVAVAEQFLELAKTVVDTYEGTVRVQEVD